MANHNGIHQFSDNWLGNRRIANRAPTAYRSAIPHVFARNIFESYLVIFFILFSFHYT